MRWISKSVILYVRNQHATRIIKYLSCLLCLSWTVKDRVWNRRICMTHHIGKPIVHRFEVNSSIDFGRTRANGACAWCVRDSFHPLLQGRISTHQKGLGNQRRKAPLISQNFIIPHETFISFALINQKVLSIYIFLSKKTILLDNKNLIGSTKKVCSLLKNYF